MTRTESQRTLWAVSDPLRVEILDRVAAGSEVTVSRLAAVLPITRQAVSRHVKTLEAAGLIMGARRGREQCYRVDTAPLEEAGRWLRARAAGWDAALDRLAHYVESGSGDGPIPTDRRP